MSRIKNELSADCLKRFAQEQYGLLGEITRESPCLQCGFTTLAGDPKTTRTDKR